MRCYKTAPLIRLPPHHCFRLC